MEVHLQETVEPEGVRLGVSGAVSREIRHTLIVTSEYTRRRLGMGPRELPKTSVYEGIPYPVQLRLPPGVSVVSLVAGGMYVSTL